MVKQFLYIIGILWAALGFLAVALLFCVVRWSRVMDVRCSSVFYCLFFSWGVSMDYGGVVSYLPKIKVRKKSVHWTDRATENEGNLAKLTVAFRNCFAKSV
jgi:predicted phage tail protein